MSIEDMKMVSEAEAQAVTIRKDGEKDCKNHTTTRPG